MPPKAVKKAQQKVVEDKTFGLKNKNKSKKVQQYVQNVQKSASLVGRNRKDALLDEQAKAAKIAAKKAEEKAAQELAGLFKTVATVKPTGDAVTQDPKTILCAYFKAGSCVRGAKCKFSHDLTLERKPAKINLYHDPREKDTMDTWNQNKLEEVVASKDSKRPNETQIVCKYFLDAVENCLYGWFWECPNGPTCIYKHRLPPGFVFRPKIRGGEVKQEVDEDAVDIADEIEEERAKLDLSKCTPITLETFMKWKEDKAKRKEADAEVKRKEDAKSTKGATHNKHFGLSGRALFKYDPGLFVDDDNAADDDAYVEDENREDDQPEVKHLDDELADVPEEGAAAAAPAPAPVAPGPGAAKPLDEELFLEDAALPEDDEHPIAPPPATA